MLECKEALVIIKEKLTSSGKHLASAESCTSGRIASLITSVSGASRYFEGGIVAYQDDVKEKMLGVFHDTIAEYDVVSRQVVEQMVHGACVRLSADFAIASTGYAEACEGHDVEIWIGWGSADDIHTLCLRDDIGRNANVDIAAKRAVEEFANYLSTL